MKAKKYKRYQFIKYVSNTRHSVKICSFNGEHIYIKSNGPFNSFYEKLVLKSIREQPLPLPDLVLTNNCFKIITRKVQGKTLTQYTYDSLQNKHSIIKQCGEILAKIHMQPLRFFYKQQEIFWIKESFSKPKEDSVLVQCKTWLRNNTPDYGLPVFIHGDYHPGNILVNENQIACILDWEFSGIGFREADIAWAVTWRENSSFYFEEDEVASFISGYSAIHPICLKTLTWFRIKCIAFFYANNSDMEFRKHILQILFRLIKKVH